MRTCAGPLPRPWWARAVVQPSRKTVWELLPQRGACLPHGPRGAEAVPTQHVHRRGQQLPLQRPQRGGPNKRVRHGPGRGSAAARIERLVDAAERGRARLSASLAAMFPSRCNREKAKPHAQISQCGLAGAGAGAAEGGGRRAGLGAGE